MSVVVFFKVPLLLNAMNSHALCLQQRPSPAIFALTCRSTITHLYTEPLYLITLRSLSSHSQITPRGKPLLIAHHFSFTHLTRMSLWPLVFSPSPPTGNTSHWQHLPLATPPTGNTSHWQPLPLATPPTGNTSHWQHLPLATPPTGNTSHWQHLPLATPPTGNTSHWQPLPLATPPTITRRVSKLSY
ncbi:unnamed protein product [Closterium sp. NIES-64]|nr:unnamed protein product [Closterium sp. NIES-64]